MCLGVPMRVVEAGELVALCARGDERRQVSVMLVGEQPVGTPLLVHLDRAVRVLDEAEVPLLEDALAAVEASRRGEPIDSFFADLRRGDEP